MYVCMYVWIILLNLNIAQLILTFYKKKFLKEYTTILRHAYTNHCSYLLAKEK